MSKITEKPVKSGIVSVKIPYLQLIHGSYTLDLYIGDGRVDLESYPNLCQLIVESKDFSGTGYLPKEHLNVFFTKDVQWKLE